MRSTTLPLPSSRWSTTVKSTASSPAHRWNVSCAAPMSRANAPMPKTFAVPSAPPPPASSAEAMAPARSPAPALRSRLAFDTCSGSPCTTHVGIYPPSPSSTRAPSSPSQPCSPSISTATPSSHAAPSNTPLPSPPIRPPTTPSPHCSSISSPSTPPPACRPLTSPLTPRTPNREQKLLALYGLKYNPFSPEIPTEALLPTSAHWRTFAGASSTPTPARAASPLSPASPAPVNLSPFVSSPPASSSCPTYPSPPSPTPAPISPTSTAKWATSLASSSNPTTAGWASKHSENVGSPISKRLCFDPCS